MLKCPCKNIFPLESNKDFIFEKYHIDFLHLCATLKFYFLFMLLKAPCIEDRRCRPQAVWKYSNNIEINAQFIERCDS